MGVGTAAAGSGGLNQFYPARAIIPRMEARELRRWLDCLAEQRLIQEWRWMLHAQPGQITVSYVIDGRAYTHEEAVKLVRHFEAAWIFSR